METINLYRFGELKKGKQKRVLSKYKYDIRQRCRSYLMNGYTKDIQSLLEKLGLRGCIETRLIFDYRFICSITDSSFKRRVRDGLDIDKFMESVEQIINSADYKPIFITVLKSVQRMVNDDKVKDLKIIADGLASQLSTKANKWLDDMEKDEYIGNYLSGKVMTYMAPIEHFGYFTEDGRMVNIK